MIIFLCKCGQTISVKEEEAGLSMQCPGCKCLVDVPTVNDLESMDTDGAIRMQPAPKTPSQLHQSMRAFGKQVDMRMDVDEFLAIGGDIPLKDEVKTPQRVRPRYDGLTGELITDIPLKEDPAQVLPQDIPMAQAALNYATVNTLHGHPLTTGNSFYRILSGTNLLCLTFAWLAHGGLFLTLLPPLLAIIAFPLVGIGLLIITAHYASVMEDIAVGDANEIPTLFRRASLSEDLIQPAQAMLGALLVSALPAIVMMMFSPPFKQRPHVIVALWIVAALLWPAFALTASTSGAINNLLPHRALSVITSSPGRYLLCLIPYLLGLACYVVIGAWVYHWFGNPFVLPTLLLSLVQLIGILITTALATYFMHLAAVWLAITYRNAYHKFNWVLQRHVKTNRTDTMAELRRLRQTGDPRVSPHRKPPTA